MKNKTVYLDDMSWIVDPNDEIERLEKDYNDKIEEKRTTKYQVTTQDGTIMEVDFENDPDFAILLEYQDEFFDSNGEFIFDKKIVKNWKYFNQKVDDFEFYIDKAKYILKSYWYYKKEIDFMKQGAHLRKMSYEMLVSVMDNMKFLDRCLDTRLAEYRLYLELIYKDGISFEKASEVIGEAKSSIQKKVEKGIRELARCLIAKERFEAIGEKMFNNCVNLEKQTTEVQLKEKIELIGELATALKGKLDNN